MATIITPEAILSYPALFEPKEGMNGGEAKYSAVLVFPKGTDLSALRKAAEEAGREKFGTKYDELMKTNKLRNPFRDDVEGTSFPEGSIRITARDKSKPGIVSRYAGPDGKPKAITDPSEMYPGCKVRASVRAFAYDMPGSRGVSFGLGNIQKLGEGERLDGRVAADREFEAYEPNSADDLIG